MLKRFTAFVAVRHILMRLRSTILVLLGVSLGVFVVTFMQSLMFGFQGQFFQILLTVTPNIIVKGQERGLVEEGRVYRGEPGTIYDQTRLKPLEKEEGIRNYREFEHRILSIPGVVAVAPYVQGRAILHFGTRDRGVGVFGINAQDYERVVEFRSKVTGDLEEFVQRRDAVILGHFLAEELGVSIGQRIRMVGAEGQEADLRVVGLFRSGITAVDRTTTFVNLRIGQAVLDYPSSVTAIALKVQTPDQARAIARQVEYLTGLESQSWQEANENFFSIIRQQNMITFGAVGMTILVAGFGIANSLITTVLEKRRDIGILRALGVTQRGIAAIFVLEGALIGIFGSVIGLALGAWVIDVMSHTRMPGRGGVSVSDTFIMERGIQIYLVSSVLAITISLVASLFPALRAARYDPVEIIRTAK